MVPRLRFPEFRDAGEWEEKELFHVCEINSCAKFLPRNFVYIDLESVAEGRLLKKKIIPRENAPSRAQRLLKAGDLIFQMVRPYQKNNYFFMPCDNLNYVASTGYAQLRAYESNRYLFQYMHHDKFVSSVLEKCSGSNYPAVNSSDLSSILVQIPSLPEQQKIADCLSSLDDLITAQMDKLAALKTHKKGLMQQLFPCEGEVVPRLRFPEFRDAGEWEEKELFHVCEINSCAKFLPRNFVYIDLESVAEGRLLKKKIIPRENAPSRAQRLLKAGDLIFQMVRPYQKNNYFFMPCDNLNYVASTGYAQLRAYESNRYLFQYMHHDKFVSSVLEKCSGSNYPAVNSSDLSSILVQIPSLPEQQKIADCLSSLDDLITAQMDKLAALKTHKKGLMQQLFPCPEAVDV